jgi:hypothetical protein
VRVKSAGASPEEKKSWLDQFAQQAIELVLDEAILFAEHELDRQLC